MKKHLLAGNYLFTVEILIKNNGKLPLKYVEVIVVSNQVGQTRKTAFHITKSE